MKPLLLALVLTADAGSDAPVRAVGVRHGLLELDDGRTLYVDGGVWLAEDLARERVANEWRLAEENRALKSSPPVAVVVAVVLGAVVGLAGGVVLTREACRRFPELCRP